MSKSKTKIATTIEQFIAEVNNSIGGRYENNGEANENKSALRIEVNFDSAKWSYHPENNTKLLVLFSSKKGTTNGRIAIRNPKGVELLREGEYGRAYNIYADDNKEEVYTFYITNETRG